MEAGRYTDELLDELSKQGDPEADAVAESFLGEGREPRAFAHHVAAASHGLPPEAQHPEVAAFLAAPVALPSWADPSQLAAGSRFYDQWGVEIGLGLLCFSLPAGYAAATYAQVLHLTARLESDAHRRVYESARMVLDVTGPNALEPGGRGHQTARRVRLMHAAVRQLILHDPRVVQTCEPGEEDLFWCEGWGIPISQEQLLGGTLDFGWSMLSVLDKLKIKYDKADADGYLQLWSVVAYLLGVRPDLLPIDRTIAPTLDPLFRRRNFSPSPAGKRMTEALIEVLNDEGPAHILHGSPVALMRLLLGEQVADTAGVPKANWTRYLLRGMLPMLRRMSLGELHDRVVRAAARQSSRMVMDEVVRDELHGETPAYEMPTHLATEVLDVDDVVDLTDSDEQALESLQGSDGDRSKGAQARDE